MNVSSSIRLASFCFLFLLTIHPAMARMYECQPSASNADQEQFETLANVLQPGDELIVHSGTYSQDGRRTVTVKGTPDRRIVIRAAEGESPLLTAGPRNNCIEFIDCAHVVIRGLRFRGGNSGVRFIRGEHVTFDNHEQNIGWRIEPGFRKTSGRSSPSTSTAVSKWRVAD